MSIIKYTAVARGSLGRCYNGCQTCSALHRAEPGVDYHSSMATTIGRCLSCVIITRVHLVDLGHYSTHMQQRPPAALRALLSTVHSYLL